LPCDFFFLCAVIALRFSIPRRSGWTLTSSLISVAHPGAPCSFRMSGAPSSFFPSQESSHEFARSKSHPPRKVYLVVPTYLFCCKPPASYSLFVSSEGGSRVRLIRSSKFHFVDFYFRVFSGHSSGEPMPRVPQVQICLLWRTESP